MRVRIPKVSVTTSVVTRLKFHVGDPAGAETGIGIGTENQFPPYIKANSMTRSLARSTCSASS